MKICFVAGTLGRGGAEKQLFYMIRALIEIGIGVRVLCLTKNEVYESKIRELEVTVDWVGRSPNRFIRLKNITENLRANTPDILQSSHFYTNIYAGLGGRFLRVPSIGAIRSDLESEIKTHGALGKWQIRLPHLLIANSLSAYRRATESYDLEKKIALVQNVVETGNCERIDNRAASPELRFLWVGRLDENKKPERFIALAADLVQKFSGYNLRFTVAGDGKRGDEIKQLARRLNLPSDKMKFLGDCADVSQLYDQSDILISTSDREGTPNVILEAMAHGLPVIATNVGGTPDILSSECGILVDPGRGDQLLQASVKLINEPKLRLRFGYNGRRYALANHSFANLKKSLPLIYSRLLERSIR